MLVQYCTYLLTNGADSNTFIAGAAPKRGEAAATSGSGKREMVTPLVRASLSKQGYKIIGSHSGVKMCRWTKSMLRGRGGWCVHMTYAFLCFSLFATMLSVSFSCS